MFVIHVVRSRMNSIISGLILLFLFLLLVAILDIMDFIPYTFIKMIILIIYFIGTCYYILRHIISTYTYSLINKEFIIRKNTGKRSVTIFDIPLKDIILIAKSRNPKIHNIPGPVKNVTVGFTNFNTYTIVFLKDNHYRKIKIEFDRQLLYVFKKLLADKVYDI